MIPAVARAAAGFALASLLAARCAAAPATHPGDRTFYTTDEIAAIYRHSPLGPPPPDPTNRVADRAPAARFGQALFYSTQLSVNNEISCATCHQPDRAFTDGKALAQALGPGTRNTPTLLDAAYQHWFFWDGRADSMWSQSLQVLENPKEFGSDRLHVAHAVYASKTLRRQYEEVFGAMPPLGNAARFPAHARPGADSNSAQDVAWRSMSEADRDAVNRVFSNAGKALQAYERKLVSRGSPFDVYVAGLRENNPAKLAVLSPSARRGLKLFVGAARCELCHAGPAFSDGEFHNIGLPVPPGQAADAGRMDGIRQLIADPFNGTGRYSDRPKGTAADKLAYLPPSASELGKFRTPTLRNVALTAPYGHDGRFATLREVVQFYADGEPAAGGQTIGVREATLKLVPRLTPEQVSDLVSFLEALSGAPLPAALVAPSAPARSSNAKGA